VVERLPVDLENPRKQLVAAEGRINVRHPRVDLVKGKGFEVDGQEGMALELMADILRTGKRDRGEGKEENVDVFEKPITEEVWSPVHRDNRDIADRRMRKNRVIERIFLRGMAPVHTAKKTGANVRVVHRGKGNNSGLGHLTSEFTEQAFIKRSNSQFRDKVIKSKCPLPTEKCRRKVVKSHPDIPQNRLVKLSNWGTPAARPHSPEGQYMYWKFAKCESPL
jgi:hypothetical protein